MAQSARTPFDYAPVEEQLRVLMDAPPLLTPPSPPCEHPASGPLRAALLDASEILSAHGPGYDADAPLAVFLAQAAGTGAIFRLRTIAHLLSEGYSGLVAAAMARSLLEDAAVWAWIAEDPRRDEAVVDQLAEEWRRLSRTLDRAGASHSSTRRWLLPPAWSAERGSTDPVPKLPATRTLIERLATPATAAPDPAEPIRFPGITTMAAVLAECGHFNRYAALLCPFEWDPEVSSTDDPFFGGGRLSPEVEAIVAHVAGAAALTICVLTSWSDPDPQPERAEILTRAGAATAALTLFADQVHRLGGIDSIEPDEACAPTPPSAPRHRVPRADLTVGTTWEPPPGQVEVVRRLAETLFEIATREGPALVAIPPVSRLRLMCLPVLASTAWAATTLAHEGRGTSDAAHSARQLLEEGCKWRWAMTGESIEQREARIEALLQEVAARADHVVEVASAQGIADDVLAPFVSPCGFDLADLRAHSGAPAELPKFSEAQLAASSEDAGVGGRWLVAAYSLLSQVTHHTPLGALHSMSPDGSTIESGAMSSQMEALAIDAGLTGARWIWRGLGTLMLGAPMADGRVFGPAELIAWRLRIDDACRRVHVAAAPLHGFLSSADLRSVGRNQPCPCTSGKKAKHCHLR